jgi:tRNA pseudouridine38-40 synthase
MNSRIAMLIEYDGSVFHGWQFQPNLPTVQGAIQAAIYEYCGQVVELQCAGRTDTGVHAVGQVAHADLAGAHDADRVMEAVNFHLRRSEFANKVAVIAAQNALPDFHARFSAISRRYQYRLVVRRAPLVIEEGLLWRISHPLNVAAMREAAQMLIGEHNFNSFRSGECQAKSAVKTLDILEIVQDGNRIIFNIKAKSFLHNQVRIMVGTLVEIGRGRYQPNIITEMLAGNHRRCAGMTAPADGLFFMEVEYEEGLGFRV